MKVYQRGSVWYVDCSYKCHRVREKVGTSKKLAIERGKGIEAELVKGEYSKSRDKKSMTLDELAKEYLIFSKANKRPQVHRRDRIIMDNLLKVFRGKMIQDISAHDLERYKARRKGEVSVSTVNREVTCIKHMFNKAVEWDYLAHNKLGTVKRFKEPPGRLRYLKKNEIERLLRVCPEHLRPIVITALNTGMRKGEIFSLVWQDIDMNNKVITIRRAKNNESRAVPINKTLYQTLKLQKNGDSGQPVFTGKDGTPLTDVKHSFARALTKANIKDFRFHDLRHTFASRLAMAGVDIRTIQELMGHKDIRMTMRYSHLSNSHLKEAVNRLCDDTIASQGRKTEKVNPHDALKNKSQRAESNC